MRYLNCTFEGVAFRLVKKDSGVILSPGKQEDMVIMSSIAVGNTVTCGMCGKETKVSFITDREGGQAYDLECFHRNAYCDACGKLVKDASETVQKLVPACRRCSPEMFEDDDDE